MSEQLIEIERELDEVRDERDELHSRLMDVESQLQQTRDELERYKSYVDTTNYNSEKLAIKLTQKEIELFAKDKVLKWYAGEQYGQVFFSPPIPDIPILHDCGEQARSILSQYEVTP